MSKKVIVSSQNQVKINAVKTGFERMCPTEEFEFIGISAPSGVSDQPKSNEETFEGAKNRAENAMQADKTADYYVGVEGGIELTPRGMECFAWIYIISDDKIGKAKTATYYLPERVVELINQGKELGEADDIVFAQKNSKQKSGSVGILTNDVIDRTAFMVDAVVLALIPFINPDLY